MPAPSPIPAAASRTRTGSRTWCSISSSPCRASSPRAIRETQEMGQPYIGEIRMFGGSFAPAGWAFCNGALIPISENDTLFTLIGTTYGGDGQETFALPDLQGRVPMHQGTLAGVTNTIGEKAGVESVTLTPN